jgi:hypothetical protein
MYQQFEDNFLNCMEIAVPKFQNQARNSKDHGVVTFPVSELSKFHPFVFYISCIVDIWTNIF